MICFLKADSGLTLGMQSLTKSAFQLQLWLHKPQKVFVFSLCFLGFSLLFNGSIFKVWGLYRDQQIITKQIGELRHDTAQLNVQIKQASDPVYIEHHARDKMDLVSENDLIFVFSEEH